ncbi:MAG TPA: lysine--tRNA ligase [Chloroflexota bacterium]|nr:lysine--tRNA ligase [Chloroflexota bacterium]
MTEHASESDEAVQRRAALDRLRARGINPFPTTFARSHTCADAAALADTPTRVTVAGRMGVLRDMGRIAFVHISDDSGRVQLLLRRQALGEVGWQLLHDLHAGDIVGAEGETLRSRPGEPSIGVETLTLLAKALQSPPEKFHGLKDVELRQRQRYLDLMSNERSREVFRTRSRVVSCLRRSLDARGFLEVETPVLQPLYGGATAQPFQTYHNELQQQLYLRISDELYLKRLIVGGFDKVYEIGHDFRNESISFKHNPEFTMLEAYQAYADYFDMMDLYEALVVAVVQEATAGTALRYQGQEIDFAPPWRRLTMRQALLDTTGLDFNGYRDAGALAAACRERGLRCGEGGSWGKLIDELVKNYVEPTLIRPTFLLDYPWELSPLAKRHRDDSQLVERFEPFVAGFELGNAFSELNDPDDQRERFLDQQRAAAQGDVDAHQLDEDYLLALQHGMPPTGGIGLGVDRLVMLLTDNHSIREVILFPHHRRAEHAGGSE